MTFAYHRSVAPMMWVFVALASTELIVVHLLVSHWWPRVAMALSVVTLLSIGWLVRELLSFRARPVAIDGRMLVMRVGSKRVVVPLADVAGLRSAWTAADLKAPGVRNLALIAYPNVLVDLRRPAGRKGRTTAIAHRLDDPAGFSSALTAALGAPSP